MRAGRESGIVLVAAVSLAWPSLGCARPSAPTGSGTAPSATGAPGCGARVSAPNPLPGVKPEQRTLAYWVDRQPDVDGVVLAPAAIRAHNQAFVARDRAKPDADALALFDLRTPVDRARLEQELEARLGFLRTRVEKGDYVALDGTRPDAAPFAKLARLPEFLSPERGGELRVALELTPLRCGPTKHGLYKAGDVQEAFDRNLCSTLRAQEPVAVLGSWPNGMKLVRSRGALGFLDPDAKLSPVATDAVADALARGPRLRLPAPTKLTGASTSVALPALTFLAKSEGNRGHFATSAGFDISQPVADADTERPLTRRALLEEAFRHLDSPYGWGGRDGGRDCSEFLGSVFGAFGLELPRNSGHQAQAGSMSIDLARHADPTVRLALVDAAFEQGIVLLSFPGHIMLYLGRSTEGTPMVMHAFAEYLEACGREGPGERLVQVDRVQVSDLALGKGTTRGSFLERLTRITILGSSAGPALEAVVERRPAAPPEARGACREGEAMTDVALRFSPRHPHPGQPLRVLVTSARELGSPALVLDDPDGRRVVPELRKTGGPPYGFLAEVPAPAEGTWLARLADGPVTYACGEATVHARPPLRQAGGGMAWLSGERWSASHERLYSMFVESLFAYPFDDRTWTNLETILADPARNILHGHHGADEERRIALEPDCADLPYFLRAYFAWKLGLPFAYRHCSRGRKGQAPYCDGELHTNLSTSPEGRDAVEKFATFARANVANGVHSGTGRTAPTDSKTDYYPVPLTREALAPGAVFADPYGHGYVVVGWVPQGLDGHGMLIGADAQPDKTIGRRRFWRGTFLFSSETTEAGAGFKRFRPLVMRGGKVVSIPNDRIVSEFPEFAPFSLEQYEHGKDGFYDRVEALVNPRPLAVTDALEVLLTALFEQVKARVTSVQNGEAHMGTSRKVIDMPKGHSVFETSGDWEDFSTPSRDMRLLIAIDTIAGFPATVRRQPARFGLTEAGPTLEQAVAELEARIAKRLGELAFEYPRSDGSSFRLTVAEVVKRAKDLEVAYNPNDCAEVRWGAPEGSEERSTCKRRAPAHQRSQLEKNRVWFASRTRPAR
ncbi:MAG: C40 family peptidase [Deltaproteobacteria bacterium]|nr:C40 family peptidase [Deltaproteobacteria bacterium]